MRITTTSLAFAFGLLLSACTVGSVDNTGDDVGDDAPGTISGAITEDATWSGTVEISGDATINAGVTVTVTPGTEISARNGVGLRVQGTLEVAGTAAAPVSMLPTADAMTWAGIVVDPGGSAHLAYAQGTDVAVLMYCHDGSILCHLDHVEFTGISQAIVAEDLALVSDSRITDIANGGITVRGTAGDLTVRDSYVLTSGGDLIVQQGGTLLVEYSEIGDTLGSYDHCDFHISGAASLTITKTNIINGVVGMMIGGTTGASITGNNWMGNDTDVQEVGTNVTVDMTGNYWANGAPTLGPDYDVSNPALEQIADAGPRL
jgi:hypothetical protein